MSFSNFAQQALSSFSNSGSQADSQYQTSQPTGGQDFSVTGGAQYNSPDNRQQGQGSYDTQAVLDHADVDDEHQGYIQNAIQHVHDNADQHQQPVNSGDLGAYSDIIRQGINSFQQSGGNVGSLFSGALGGSGGNGGNQLMGHVLKQAGSAFSNMDGAQKQNLMNGAAMAVTKLMSQNQLSPFTGGGNSGGLGMLSNIGQSFLQNRSGN